MGLLHDFDLFGGLILGGSFLMGAIVAEVIRMSVMRIYR